MVSLYSNRNPNKTRGPQTKAGVPFDPLSLHSGVTVLPPCRVQLCLDPSLGARLFTQAAGARLRGSHMVGWGEEGQMGTGSRLSRLVPTSLLLLLGHTATCLLPYWGSELSAEGGSGKGYVMSVSVLTTKGVHSGVGWSAGAPDVSPKSSCPPTASKQGWREASTRGAVSSSQAGRHTRPLGVHSEPHLSLLQHLRTQQEDWNGRTL